MLGISRLKLAVHAALATALGMPVQVPSGRGDGINEIVMPDASWGRARKGAGISVAAQKRASVKKRNVARNRSAHRA